MFNIQLLRYFSALMLTVSMAYSSQINQKEHSSKSVRSIEDIMEMSPVNFENDIYAQSMVFAAAENWKEQMHKFCQNVKSKLPQANCRVTMKANTVNDLTKTILKKCSGKKLDSIGKMNDIARARVDVSFIDEIRIAIVSIIVSASKSGLKVKKIKQPRRPIMEELRLFGYPRWHILFSDDKGFTFEWQIGTKNVTTYYETPGISVAKGLNLAPSIKNNLHNIAYKIFGRTMAHILAGKTEEEKNLSKKIRVFLKELDFSLAIAGHFKLSHAYVQDDIKELHVKASEVLAEVEKVLGQEFILKLLN